MIPPAVVLMEVFKLVAERSLLGFAMVVGIFERTSYREKDPLTSLLNAGRQTQAGKQIDIHLQINDAGGHENVPLGFLSHMAAVDQDYATEALRMAELATLVSHRLSVETLKMLKQVR